MDDVATLIAKVREEGQFDASETQALGWLNDRHLEMVAGAKSYRARVAVGVTTAGEGNYTMPAGLLEVYDLSVDGEARTKTRRADSGGFAANRISYSGSGFFAEDSSSGGVEGITLLPAPATSGQSIEAFAALLPADLTLADPASALRVDADMGSALVAGAIALGLLRLEQRADLAAPHEQVFSSAVETLRRRVARRLRGGGPAQIRVIGVNA